MIYLIKFILHLFIFINIASYVSANETDRILFSIKDKIFTSIDLDNRIKYRKLLYGDLSIDNNDIFKDLVNVAIFSHFYDNNLKEIDDNVIENIYENIFLQYENTKEINNFTKIFKSLDKKIIIRNIEFDWKKKIILQNEIDKQRENLLKVDEDLELGIYYYKLDYITLNTKHDKIINKIVKKINFKEIEKILKENKISFISKSKEIKDLKKIDKKILNIIKKNKTDFILKQKSNILIGKITKKIKNLEDLKLTMIQITSKNIINQSSVNCNNINDLKNKKDFKIIEHKSIDYTKINEEVKSKLKNINDRVYFENNENNYLILCKIDYNKELVKKNNLNDRVQNLVEDIEIKFIRQKKIDYDFVNYE